MDISENVTGTPAVLWGSWSSPNPITQTVIRNQMGNSSGPTIEKISIKNSALVVSEVVSLEGLLTGYYEDITPNETISGKK